MASSAHDTSLTQARIVQVDLLGTDVLVAFSNGTTVLLAVEQVRHLALTAAKLVVTADEAER